MSEIKEFTIDFLKVLADQTRLDILLLIKNEELTQEDLTKELKKSQSTISQHLNLLSSNSIITYDLRNKKKYYTVKDQEIYNILAKINQYVIKTNKEKLSNLINSDILEVLWDI
jgi:DNA-binding transcriptional ArsR family regulator